MKSLRNVLAQVPFLKGRLGIAQSSCDTISKQQIVECVGKKNPTILEIGCNDGSHTLWFLELFETPQVFCFEPEPRAIARFREKVDERPSVKLIEMAISDRNGEITFHQSDGKCPNKKLAKALPKGWDLSGSIRKPKNHLEKSPWVTFENSITVKTSTLDTWFKKSGIEIVDFIWMDVQGAEEDVFQGAKETLSKTRFVYTEYNNNELYEGQPTLEQILAQVGQFELMTKYPNDVLLRNTQIENFAKAG